MIRKVKISFGKKEGTVSFDDSKKGKHRISVQLNDDVKRAEVIQYLISKREYLVPGRKLKPGQIGGAQTVQQFPYDSQTYFELALSSMYCQNGIWVDWGEETTEEK